MDKKHKIIIADSYQEEAQKIKEELSGKYHVISIRDNGKDALEDIIRLQPDLVIIDLMLPVIDGLGVIEQCRKIMRVEKIPAFIVLTVIENGNIMTNLRRLKVDYCMMKPFDPKILGKRIPQMIHINDGIINDHKIQEIEKEKKKRRYATKHKALDMRRQISNLVRNMGVPAHIKGCRYMKMAILIAMKDPNSVNYITKLLYPEIAKKFNTNSGSVERAIRHAIDIIWMKGNKELLREIFGTFTLESQERPTNSKFIAAVADWMRLEYQIKVS